MNVITSKISMDLMTAPKELPVIHTVQGERSTRAVELSLFCAGSPWQIPDGGCAYSYEENRVTIILDPQMMAVSGPVTAQVELIHGDQMLATFSFKVMVAVNPAVGIVEPEVYVNWQKWLEQELDKYVEKVSQGGQLLGGTMAGPINMNSHVLNGLNLPVSNDQAANMEFVNRQIEKNVLRKINWTTGILEIR